MAPLTPLETVTATAAHCTLFARLDLSYATATATQLSAAALTLANMALSAMLTSLQVGGRVAMTMHPREVSVAFRPLG